MDGVMTELFMVAGVSVGVFVALCVAEYRRIRGTRYLRRDFTPATE